MPRFSASVILYLLFLAVMASIALWRPAVFDDRLEIRLVDWLFHVRRAYKPPVPPAAAPSRDPLVVIVAIDDASIRRYGSWPWPRSRVAELIEKTIACRPKTLAIDLPLHDPGSPWDDARIGRALAALPGKTTAAFKVRLGPPFGASVPERLLASAITRVDRPGRLQPLEAGEVLLPDGPIADAALLGHDLSDAAATGQGRRESLYLRFGGAMIPSLAFQTARIADGVSPEDVRILDSGQIELGRRTVPADPRGLLPVNYYGGEGSIARYSAESILRGELDPNILANKVVFVGGTTDIAVDFVSTPFSENLPVVEKDATVAANILAGDFLCEAPPVANLLLLLTAGVAVPFVIRRRAILSLLSLLLGIGLVLVAAALALFLGGFLFSPAYPLLVLFGAGGVAVLHQHLKEIRISRRLRRLFSSYVTQRVLDRLIADPAMTRPGGERRDLTILFMDIRGFTSFSEKHPPEEVVRTLNEYLEAMTEVIFRWEGTLDKFIGDTILAFWGAPLPQEDHPERALRCALHLCLQLDLLNAEWATTGRPALEIGIGITTGQVIVGNIGAEGKKMDYTVIGDRVNVCSRVEELTKEFRARILITADTFTRLRPLFAAGALGHISIEGLAAVPIKGKEEPVRLFRVWPLQHGASTSIEEFGAAAPDA